MSIIIKFEQIWEDVLKILQYKKEIKTLCKGVKNDVISITQDFIILKSERSRKGLMRKITKDDFEYVWNKLKDDEIYTLNTIHGIIGRRAITCAILALLDYIKGECHQGKVRLSL